MHALRKYYFYFFELRTCSKIFLWRVLKMNSSLKRQRFVNSSLSNNFLSTQSIFSSKQTPIGLFMTICHFTPKFLKRWWEKETNLFVVVIQFGWDHTGRVNLHANVSLHSEMSLELCVSFRLSLCEGKNCLFQVFVEKVQVCFFFMWLCGHEKRILLRSTFVNVNSDSIDRISGGSTETRIVESVEFRDYLSWWFFSFHVQAHSFQESYNLL